MSDKEKKEVAALSRSLAIYVVAIAILIFLTIQSYVPLWQADTKGMDINFIYIDSESISEGINPYSRIHSSDMIHNEKYTTYFPMFFVLGAGVIKAGINDYISWVMFWRRIFLICSICIGIAIFKYFYKIGQGWFGIFCMAFWLFNRWTMYVVFVGQIEFVAMLPFLLSFLLLQKKPKTAMLLYSLSLAIKHIAIFIFPLYIFWGIQALSEKNKRKNLDNDDNIKSNTSTLKETFSLKNILIITALAFSVVGGISIPFLIADPMALIKSVFFSATREGMDSTPGMNYVIMQFGLRGRLILFIFLFGIYLLSVLKKISVSEAILFCIMIFLGFNPVFFNQYVVWVIPFIFFVLGERFIQKNQSMENQKTV